MTATRDRKRRVTGAILVGGMSSRMGAPKHLIVLPDGRAMIKHVMDAMSQACSQIVIVGADKAQGLPSLGSRCVRIVEDLRPAQGPLGGIEALLASGIDEEYLVCPCDVPRVTHEVFEALLTETEALSTVLRVGRVGREKASPLPARVSARAIDVVRELLDEGRRAVHVLHERLGAHVVEVPAEWKPLLVNVNSPEDLADLNRR